MTINVDGRTPCSVWREGVARAKMAQGFSAFVAKDAEAVKAMSHKRFQAFADARVVSKMLAIPHVFKGLDRIVEDRRINRLMMQTYVCSGVSLHASPECHLISIQEARGLPFIAAFPGCRVVMQPEAGRAYKAMPKAPLDSVDDLNRLVEGLYDKYEIAWDYTEDGCRGRAYLMADLLQLSGIPETHIQLQYHMFPRDTGKLHGWTYHVALRVRLSNGCVWIVDPALEPRKAMTLEDWAEKQTTAFFIDEGMRKQGDVISYGKVFDRNAACLFRAPLYAGGLYVNEKSRQARLIAAEDVNDSFDYARYRSIMERRWWAAALDRE